MAHRCQSADSRSSCTFCVSATWAAFSRRRRRLHQLARQLRHVAERRAHVAQRPIGGFQGRVGVQGERLDPGEEMNHARQRLAPRAHVGFARLGVPLHHLRIGLRETPRRRGIDLDTGGQLLHSRRAAPSRFFLAGGEIGVGGRHAGLTGQSRSVSALRRSASRLAASAASACTRARSTASVSSRTRATSCRTRTRSAASAWADSVAASTAASGRGTRWPCRRRDDGHRGSRHALDQFRHPDADPPAAVTRAETPRRRPRRSARSAPLLAGQYSRALSAAALFFARSAILMTVSAGSDTRSTAATAVSFVFAVHRRSEVSACSPRLRSSSKAPRRASSVTACRQSSETVRVGDARGRLERDDPPGSCSLGSGRGVSDRSARRRRRGCPSATPSKTSSAMSRSIATAAARTASSPSSRAIRPRPGSISLPTAAFRTRGSSSSRAIARIASRSPSGISSRYARRNGGVGGVPGAVCVLDLIAAASSRLSSRPTRP